MCAARSPTSPLCKAAPVAPTSLGDVASLPRPEAAGSAPLRRCERYFRKGSAACSAGSGARPIAAAAAAAAGLASSSEPSAPAATPVVQASTASPPAGTLAAFALVVAAGSALMHRPLGPSSPVVVAA
eukprot:scaffold83_cov286-Prasinococcus_capsulatus_cf.AAC.4